MQRKNRRNHHDPGGMVYPTGFEPAAFRVGDQSKSNVSISQKRTTCLSIRWRLRGVAKHQRPERTVQHEPAEDHHHHKPQTRELFVCTRHQSNQDVQVMGHDDRMGI